MTSPHKKSRPVTVSLRLWRGGSHVIVGDMDEFEDLIAQIQGATDGAPPAATVYDDLTRLWTAVSGERDAALSQVSEASSAAAAKDARIVELEGEISRLKSHAFDRLLQQPGPQQEAPPADNKPQGIDGLFGSSNKGKSE